MATTTELQKKLTDKLRELFQLDQPDLDFGFYRVMHAKQKEITDYLETKLPAAITAAFKDSGSGAIDALEAAYHASVAQAQSFGAPDPEATEPVKKAKKAWEDAKAAGNAQSDVYDHLYHFFERYYDKGDFVSLRYLTRETDKHAKPYAIPYAGEEVMLHWANADQYYIKTSENFSHFSVDITQHPVFRKMDAMERMTLGIPAEPLKLHFNVVDADEGEHGNVKAGKDRFFILYKDEPCAMKEDGLHVNFEYRADSDKQGTASKWQEELRKKAQQAIRTEISEDVAQVAELLTQTDYPPEYAKLLFHEYEVGEGREKQTILGSYLKRYMARNTADYFIHKDLGGFLRRELDFYIKNDLMILDDVTAATPETVAKWLGKTKAFRTVALDIIAFLAQLEDFQKKLWLKKKFVVQCDYCLTMDRVPDELKSDVLANAKQQAAWAALGTDVDPKSQDVMAVDARMVDTQYFDEDFKQKLLASVDDFDERCNGVLVHSDNFQGLRFVGERYHNKIKCIYIDPPYNTEQDREVGNFKYKDSYENSSWASLMFDRVICAADLLRNDGTFWSSIDHNEIHLEKLLLEMVFGRENFEGLVTWRRRHNQPNDKTKMIGMVSEYILSYAKHSPTYKAAGVGKVALTGDFSNPDNDPRGDWASKPWKVGSDQSGSRYDITTPSGAVLNEEWMGDENTYKQLLAEGRIYFPKKSRTEEGLPRKKYYRSERLQEGQCATNWWGCEQFGHNQGGNDTLTSLYGYKNAFSNPKPVELLRGVIMLANVVEGIVLDYFAGSGTTAHAVIDLNRQDAENGKRKYILIEMGDHFDTVLMPRIQKVVYSPDWKDGKPETNVKGISHCFKYLRLESYEDTLNNLTVDAAKGAAFAGVQDYFLKYMLDVETKESPSLLRMGEIANPSGCKLMVKKPASEEREERVVDLVETFNYLIGLRVKNTAAMRSYSAEFERVTDPELPSDGHTKLTIKGAIKKDAEGPWKFRTVEGWVPKNRFTPNDGAKERVLIVWRTLTDDREKDNAVLDYFLQHKEGVNPLSGDYDVIYVNGSNNVPNLKQDGDTWKVRLIEDDFQSRMWEGC